VEILVELRRCGYKLATGGGASGEEQRRQWIERLGIDPNYAVSKAEVADLKNYEQEVIHVDNDPVAIPGVKHMFPADFLEWFRRL